MSAFTDVTLTIQDLYGTSLLAATACTVFTANTLNAAVEADADNLVLASALTGATPVKGDRYLIDASASGPEEVVTCSYYNSSTKTIYFEEDCRYDHASGTAVKGLYCYYSLDTKAGLSTYTKNKQMVLLWTPNSTAGIAVTERAEIAYTATNLNLEDSFARRYNREYRVIIANDGSFADYAADAIDELRQTLRNKAINPDRIVDQEILRPALISQIRYMVAVSGGDDWKAEREAAEADYKLKIAELTAAPIWSDTDQDISKDDEEVVLHATFPTRMQRGGF